MFPIECEYCGGMLINFIKGALLNHINPTANPITCESKCLRCGRTAEREGNADMLAATIQELVKNVQQAVKSLKLPKFPAVPDCAVCPECSSANVGILGRVEKPVEDSWLDFGCVNCGHSFELRGEVASLAFHAMHYAPVSVRPELN